MKGKSRCVWLAMSLAVAWMSATGCTQGLRTGSMAPDFKLQSSGGDTVALSQYRGKVVLVNFFGVGCPPCQVEAPHVKTLYEKYHDRGLEVVAVNAWDDAPHDVQSFVRTKGLPYPVLLNGSEVHEKKYRGEVVPITYLIDAEGKVIYMHRGWGSGDEKKLAARIEKALPA